MKAKRTRWALTPDERLQVLLATYDGIRDTTSHRAIRFLAWRAISRLEKDGSASDAQATEQDVLRLLRAPTNGRFRQGQGERARLQIGQLLEIRATRWLRAPKPETGLEVELRRTIAARSTERAAAARLVQLFRKGVFRTPSGRWAGGDVEVVARVQSPYRVMTEVKTARSDNGKWTGRDLSVRLLVPLTWRLIKQPDDGMILASKTENGIIYDCVVQQGRGLSLKSEWIRRKQ